MTKIKPKILIIYFSHDEKVEQIAIKVAKTVDADTIRLAVIQRKGEPKVQYLWGNESVSMNPEPELEDFEVNPEDYDLILLGSPVWGMNYAPPFRTFFKKVNLEGKMVAFFCVHEGVPGVIFDEFEKALIGNDIMGRLSLQIPDNGNLKNEPEEAATWAREVMNKSIGLE